MLGHLQAQDRPTLNFVCDLAVLFAAVALANQKMNAPSVMPFRGLPCCPCGPSRWLFTCSLPWFSRIPLAGHLIIHFQACRVSSVIRLAGLTDFLVLSTMDHTSVPHLVPYWACRSVSSSVCRSVSYTACHSISIKPLMYVIMSPFPESCRHSL